MFHVRRLRPPEQFSMPWHSQWSAAVSFLLKPQATQKPFDAFVSPEIYYLLFNQFFPVGLGGLYTCHPEAQKARVGRLLQDQICLYTKFQAAKIYTR